MAEKIRIDRLLVDKGLISSRTKAQAAIEKGLVRVGGAQVKKASELFDEFAEVDLLGQPYKYVSRAGEKLDKALCNFGISLLAKKALDIGASTGGFTHCLLEHGARLVYAVDVGSSQLDMKLLADKRVISVENTDIRDFEPRQTFDIIVTDVSFISLTLIADPIYRMSDESTDIVLLIKPQFECGKVKLGKNGVVTDPSIHCRVISEITRHYADRGFGIKGLDYSPIRGGEGNIEFLLHIKKDGKSAEIDIDKTVTVAHRLG